MSRLRITFTTSAVFVAMAALTLSSLAQPPGRNGGGGPPGGGFGRGFGGPGGFGGFGGPGGGSLLMLALNPAVQDDMKLKDKQKAQIKSLNDKYSQQMQELRTEFGFNFGGPGQRGGPQGKGQARGQGQNGDPNAQVPGQGGGFGGGGGGQGQDPNAPGFGQNQGGGRGNRGNRNQNGQGVPEDPEVAQQRELAREAMNELRQSAESSLGKILEKGQAIRLKQIQLQLEGPSAVVCQNPTHPHGDMIDKLQIDDSQQQMISDVRDERREAQRETGQARREIMKTAFASIPRNTGQNVADNAGGQNGGNAQNGGNGRNGGRGRGFDPEAMRKVMDDPKIQAQMEEIRGQEEKIDNQFTVAINKVLTGRQRNIYKKMLGAPFDRSKMFEGGGPWGGRRGNGPASQAKAQTGAKAAKPSGTADATTTNDDEGTTTEKAAASAPTKPKAASTSKRRSLRELRGVPDSKDDQ
jgi:hypothetical protein